MSEAWHGTVGGYTNRRCRCDECRRAYREYKREARGGGSREELLAAIRGRPEAEHGTLKRYRKWGCRCAECRARVADARRQARIRAKDRLAS